MVWKRPYSASFRRILFFKRFRSEQTPCLDTDLYSNSFNIKHYCRCLHYIYILKQLFGWHTGWVNKWFPKCLYFVLVESHQNIISYSKTCSIWLPTEFWFSSKRLRQSIYQFHSSIPVLPVSKLSWTESHNKPGILGFLVKSIATFFYINTFLWGPQTNIFKSL